MTPPENIPTEESLDYFPKPEQVANHQPASACSVQKNLEELR
jgi:hypothetical protein